MTTEENRAPTSSSREAGGQWGEEYADVVELVSERAQQVGRTVSDFARQRPYLTAVIGAAVAGTFLGFLVGGVLPRRRRMELPQAARIAATWRPRGFMRPRAPAPGAGDSFRSAFELVPIGIRLMSNPLVRQLAVRAVTGAMRRRGR